MKGVNPINFYHTGEDKQSHRKDSQREEKPNFNGRQVTASTKFNNSTLILKTPHGNSNDAIPEHHNLSARTLETKNSFNNISKKLPRTRKRSVKRRLNQTNITDEKRRSNKSFISNERNRQNQLFIKRKINRPELSNVYQTTANNLKTQKLKTLEQQATP